MPSDALRRPLLDVVYISFLRKSSGKTIFFIEFTTKISSSIFPNRFYIILEKK